MSNRLTCVDHSKRVHVLPASVVHRTDGSTCNSGQVNINGRDFTPQQVREFAHQQPPKSDYTWRGPTQDLCD